MEFRERVKSKFNGDDHEATVTFGGKSLPFRSNEEAMEFADSIDEAVRWQVKLKRTGRIVESEHYRIQKADEAARGR